MTVAVTKTEAERALKSQFEAKFDALPGNEWVRGLRREAFAEFDREGLPTRRNEPFKYTDLRALIREVAEFSETGNMPVSETDLYDVLGVDLDELDAYRIVIIDGRFNRELSHFDRAAGLEVMPLQEVLDAPPDWFRAEFGKVNPPPGSNPVLALNTAFMTDGAVIRVAEKAVIDKPVHLISVTGSTQKIAIAHRNFVTVGAGAKITLLETYAYRRMPFAQRNAATEMIVGDGAEVHHLKYQNEGVDALHLSTWMTRIGARAKYNAFQFALGGGLARSQIYARFAGEGAQADISGAMMQFGRQHCDLTMLVDHAVPHCTSRELFKAVLDDEARGIFQGKILVRPHAQKTDAKEMARALLLSPRAEFDAKPELEIYADDVACGHGATSGEIDENMLFYLRSRGIPEDLAKTMLITAFIDEAIDLIEDEAIREAFKKISCGWLGCR